MEYRTPWLSKMGRPQGTSESENGCVEYALNLGVDSAALFGTSGLPDGGVGGATQRACGGSRASAGSEGSVLLTALHISWLLLAQPAGNV